jgi:hypothetical protein
MPINPPMETHQQHSPQPETDFGDPSLTMVAIARPSASLCHAFFSARRSNRMESSRG